MGCETWFPTVAKVANLKLSYKVLSFAVKFFICSWVHSWLGYQKRKKRLKDFFDLLCTNEMYMKQT
jgi:hypothetical protein